MNHVMFEQRSKFTDNMPVARHKFIEHNRRDAGSVHRAHSQRVSRLFGLMLLPFAFFAALFREFVYFLFLYFLVDGKIEFEIDQQRNGCAATRSKEWEKNIHSICENK